MPRSLPQAKHWMLTLYNSTKAHVQAWFDTHKSKIESCAACTDVGELDHDHIHIMVSMKELTSGKFFQDTLSPQVHMEVARRYKQCYMYVLGEGEHAANKEVFIEYRTPKVSRATVNRVKSDVFWKAVQGAKSEVEIKEVLKRPGYEGFIPMLKQAKFFIRETLSRNMIRPVPRMVVWLNGHTGTGKSLLANKFMDLHQPSSAYMCSTAGQISGPDNDPRSVLLDDFNIALTPLTTLFNLTDQYNKTIDVKGSYMWYHADFIFITTIYSPYHVAGMEQTYCTPHRKISDHDQEQLSRRINLYIKTASPIPNNLDGYRVMHPDGTPDELIPKMNLEEMIAYIDGIYSDWENRANENNTEVQNNNINIAEHTQTPQQEEEEIPRDLQRALVLTSALGMPTMLPDQDADDEEAGPASSSSSSNAASD